MDTIGLVLPFAVGVALSPMSIVAVIVLAHSTYAAVNAGAFAAGWLLGLVLGSLVMLLLTGLLGVGGTSTPAWVPIARIGGGVALLLFAWERAGARRSGSIDGAGPAWVLGLERLSADRALGMGAIQAALDPRKLLIIAAVVLGVSQAGQGSTEALVSMLVFVLVGSLGVAIPLAWPRIVGSSSRGRMELWRDRLAEDNPTIQGVTYLLLGTLLAGQGLAGL